MSALLEALRTRQPLATANLRGMQDRWEAPPDTDEDAADPDTGMDDAIALIGRASRALVTNKRAAADLLREAATLLGAIAEEVEQ